MSRGNLLEVRLESEIPHITASNSNSASQAALTPELYTVEGLHHKLKDKEADSKEYGKILGTFLLGASEIRDDYQAALLFMKQNACPFRIRLEIPDNVETLHSFRWKTITEHEEPYESLVMKNGLLFSRHIESRNPIPIALKPKCQINALTVIVNPMDIGDYSQAKIDSTQILKNFREQLPDVTIKPVAGNGNANINQIREELPTGAELPAGYDIFYLFCHGLIIVGSKGETPILQLENKDKTNTAEKVKANKLINAIRALNFKYPGWSFLPHVRAPAQAKFPIQVKRAPGLLWDTNLRKLVCQLLSLCTEMSPSILSRNF